MRASIIIAALFSALAIAAPIARPEAEAWGVVPKLPKLVTGSESTGKNTAAAESAATNKHGSVQGSSTSGKKSSSSESSSSSKDTSSTSSSSCGLLACASSSGSSGPDSSSSSASSSGGLNIAPEVDPSISL